MFGRQLSLQLFDPPPFNDLMESRTRAALSVTVNPRLRRGWNVRVNRFTGKRTLTVPGALAQAPEDIKRALIEWAMLPLSRIRRDGPTRRRRRELERIAREFLQTSASSAYRSRRVDADAVARAARGATCNLREVFDELNWRFFDGKLDSMIRWGTPGSVMSYQTFRADGQGNRRSLITIGAVYDVPGVPPEALRGVVYHEMLHILVPPKRVGGRNRIHGPEFKAGERASPYFAAWRKWEKTELPALARRVRLLRHGRPFPDLKGTAAVLITPILTPSL